jgi:hypothetical protein
LEISLGPITQQEEFLGDHRIFAVKGELLCVSIKKRKAAMSKTAAGVGFHALSRGVA